MAVLIVGATSDMAKAVAHVYAQKGTPLHLVARDRQALEVLAQDLRIRYEVPIHTHQVDLTEKSAVRQWKEHLLDYEPPFDRALIAVGYLGDEAKARTDLSEVERIIQVNYTAVVWTGNAIASYFVQKKIRGTLGIIASVAGLRGRAANYYYGSSKAAVIAYASGLRAWGWRHGIRVTTFLPGFVQTKMIRHLRTPKRLTVLPEEIAPIFYKGLEKGKKIVYVPFYWRWIMGAITSLPETIFMRMGF
ncbi:MAG: SDR family NAD(P)-dependent oxidoreductase [Bacteroidia bacterium]